MRPLKTIIQNLRAKKSLGQNFLIDPHILSRIVTEAGPLEGRTVIEVGSGPGGLSREIIKYPCEKIILIEQDDRCLPYLEELRDVFHENSMGCKPNIPKDINSLPKMQEGTEPLSGKFEIIHGDALSMPLHALGKKPRKIIANLPYNISVPILLGCLKHMEAFESLTLMFQKEVALRLIASPNTSAYGRLSVMCQAFSHVKKLFDLPPGAFIPPPKVSSTVVQLTQNVSRETFSWEPLEKITKAAFSQRRKMLRSSLRGIFSASELEVIGINPERRAEDLSVQEFCLLSRKIS
jgi:16S rRNA (adenine1518-N6/adenine1519-N6)-dimethyltransferase